MNRALPLYTGSASRCVLVFVCLFFVVFKFSDCAVLDLVLFGYGFTLFAFLLLLPFLKCSVLNMHSLFV